MIIDHLDIVPMCITADMVRLGTIKTCALNTIVEHRIGRILIADNWHMIDILEALLVSLNISLRSRKYL